ncbi:clathrin-coated vesicle protein [Coniophora puteana RWD-64-598 SS2]|uniref:Clathrin-coated vesicle protein n=1 Tax=Coniophora puteana (strain RWD-64-598) TaxID=741705 RepID=A0A5M3N1R6_CONPW|nr:clathrin-coated vesicle protein [Coniophora puteana RWD-64-598 SS2]EIW85333.1 clathrin-coated vesicle protein [Coniophora puteana RWD-64-598 SS2]
MFAKGSETVIDDIDESQLTGDNGELYLFQWVSYVEKALKAVHADEVNAKQQVIEATLLKVVNGNQPYPPPGRALRDLLVKCYVTLYTRGDTRSLFDTFQTFIKIAGDVKAPNDLTKITAYSALGALMLAFGSNHMSFMAELSVIVQKTLKSSSSPHIRYHALVSMRKALETARKALPDNTAKDVIKQLKNALNDKALSVQRAAANALAIMYTPEEFVTLADVESTITLCVRSGENADQLTRQALAQLVGHLLAATQVERSAPIPEPPKAKKGGEDAAEESTPSHAMAENKKPLLTPSEMLSQLSTHFLKNQTSRKSRASIFDFYVALIQKLGSEFAETNYSLIVSHFMTEIASSSKSSATRFDKLFVRKAVGVILRELIAVRMLSEQGQIAAIQELSSAYLKKWPALMPGQTSPSSLILTLALQEVSALLQQLGNAPPPLQDAILDPLMNLLSHPSHTVRINASWTLRCFCHSTPLRLQKAMHSVADLLRRDIESMQSLAAPSDVDKRALGHAYGLAALVAIIPLHPLYVSFDAATDVLDTATQLLKRASEHDVRIAGAEVEIAWTLIAALNLLGPNFVRPHLPQLLVLWRNALPKATSKDAMNRSPSEWEFLLHVRESALGAILCFLKHNATLLTLDVGRRVSSLLSNALAFSNSFDSQSIEDSEAPSLEQKGLSLRAREAALRRRIYQCFTALGLSTVTESTQSSLLQSATTIFANPEGRMLGSAMQAAIASSSGSFTSIWQVTDGFAYGVTTVPLVDEEDVDTNKAALNIHKAGQGNELIEGSLTLLLRRPILGACEHDPLSLCLPTLEEVLALDIPPPTTGVVDEAIVLFSQLLPLQDVTSTARVISGLVEALRSPKLEKSPGRKAAMTVNIMVAILQTLRLSTTIHYRQAKETLGNPQVTSVLAPFLKDILIDADSSLRMASSEALGRLANVAGTAFLTNQTKTLVDHVVNKRDPQGRAGCALAFGAIYSHVGGLAAGPLLKTTVNILMSLSNDPHPLVHFWSLVALARVVHAANLAFSPFISATLTLMLKIYLSEHHETEGGTLNNANMSGELQASPVVCRIVDAIITVLGPDMHESERTRTLILDLVNGFTVDLDEMVSIEAIKCIQHLLMFSPEHLDIPEVVKYFRSHLISSRRPLKRASIDALYQLVQKDALEMSKLGGDRMVEDLFSMLDDDPSVGGVREVISSWLQQTAIHNPSAWIDLCQRIMLRSTASQQMLQTNNTSMDDEGQSLSVSIQDSSRSQDGPVALTSRWRTQLFALHCLHDICTVVTTSGRMEHIDLLLAKRLQIPTRGLLVSRLPDLIKMAFTASAAYVIEIRLEGLLVLKDVIETFRSAPDPEYPEALLLEQHQAPIAAALTPAFSADSSPEIVAAAIDACAVFIGSGVVKDVSRMGRILKQLTSALEQTDEAGNLSVGKLIDMSPTASGMLRISVLAAWAQLELASTKQLYLQDVIRPYRSVLAPQWVACLRDYALIRADSEFVHDTSSVVDSSYTQLGKVVLLPFYNSAWPLILQAVGKNMEEAEQHMLNAMAGQTDSTPAAPARNTNEPVPTFFIVLGIIYEALVTSPPDSVSHEDISIASLRTLKCLASPRYSGKALLEPTVFKELISLCNRLAMVEPAGTLLYLTEVLQTLVMSFDDGSHGSEAFPPDSIRMHCSKICAHMIRHSVQVSSMPSIQGDVVNIVKMINGAFSTFETIAKTLSGSVREDVRGVACMLFAELLKDETRELDLNTPLLPCLKALLSIPIDSSPEAKDVYSKLIYGLLSSCLLNVDEMRGREGAISTRKVKSNLLAAVLIITIVPRSIKVARGVVEHLFFLITQKLDEGEEMALIAVHCAKTVAIAASENELLRASSRSLLPGLIEYIARLSPKADESFMNEQQLTSVEETWKTFNAFISTLPQDKRSRLLGVILPTMTLCLRPSQSTLSPLHSITVKQLLSFATSSPDAFKEATNHLDVSAREPLEQSLRRALGGNGQGNQQAAKPQISLRSF